jgi:hypothetical protein
MNYMVLTIFVMAALLTSLVASTVTTINPASAAKSCGDRGMTDGCLPGQHRNEKTNKAQGNPHYPQVGGDRTGNPHGDTSFNPDKGDPHCDADERFC